MMSSHSASIKQYLSKIQQQYEWQYDRLKFWFHHVVETFNLKILETKI